MPLKSVFMPRFKKTIKALPPDDRLAVDEAINNFLRKTGKFDIIRLKDNLWRLKEGPWRVFFLFDGDLITFLYVERRTSKTY